MISPQRRRSSSLTWVYPAGFYGDPGTPDHAVAMATELLGVMNMTGSVPVLRGAGVRLDDLMKRAKGALGEGDVLGDNPLVLMTALQSSWEPDPSSSDYTLVAAPPVTGEGEYEKRSGGREIRVYHKLDTRVMFEDLYAKIALFHEDSTRQK